MRKVTTLTAIGALAFGLAACSDSGGDKESFCEVAKKMDETDNAVETPDEIEQAVKDAKAVREIAPSEIKDEVGIVVDALERFASGDLTEFTAEEQAEFEQAAAALEKYLDEECGIAPSGS